MRIALLVLPLVASCATVRLVPNQSRTMFFAKEYGDDAVHDAVVRAISHRKLFGRRDEAGLAVAEAVRSEVQCLLTVKYSATNVDVSVTGPTGDDPAKIDSRCDEESRQLARSIDGEVKRPEKQARKEAKLERRREQAAARANAAAAAAQTMQQQVYETPPPPPVAAELPMAQPIVIQPPVTSVTPAPPPPAATPPPSVNVRSSTSSRTQVSTTVSSTTTVVNRAAPEPAPAPRIKPNTCCTGGRAFVCPNTAMYMAACVQKTTDLATACPLEAQLNQFCPR